MKILNLIYFFLFFTSIFSFAHVDYQKALEEIHETVENIINYYKKSEHFKTLFSNISRDISLKIIEKNLSDLLDEGNIQDYYFLVARSEDKDKLCQLIRQFYGPDFSTLVVLFAKDNDHSIKLLSPYMEIKYKLSILKHYFFWNGIKKLIKEKEFQKKMQDKNCLQQAYLEIIMEKLMIHHIHRLNFMKEVMADVLKSICTITERTLSTLIDLSSYSEENFAYFNSLLFPEKEEEVDHEKKVDKKGKKKDKGKKKKGKGNSSKSHAKKKQNNQEQVKKQKLVEPSSNIKLIQLGLNSILESIQGRLKNFHDISLESPISQFLLKKKVNNENFKISISHFFNITNAFSIPNLKDEILEKFNNFTKLENNFMDYFTSNKKILKNLDKLNNGTKKTFINAVLIDLNQRYKSVKEELDKAQVGDLLTLKKWEEELNILSSQIDHFPSSGCSTQLEDLKDRFKLISEEYAEFDLMFFEKTKPLFKKMLKNWSQYSNFRLFFTQDEFQKFFKECNYNEIREILDKNLINKIFIEFFNLREETLKFLTENCNLDVLLDQDGVNKLIIETGYSNNSNFESQLIKLEKLDLKNQLSQLNHLKEEQKLELRNELDRLENYGESVVFKKMRDYRYYNKTSNNQCAEAFKIQCSIELEEYYGSFLMPFVKLDKNKKAKEVSVEDIKNYLIERDLENLHQLQGLLTEEGQKEVINFQEMQKELEMYSLLKESLPYLYYSRGVETPIGGLMNEKRVDEYGEEIKLVVLEKANQLKALEEADLEEEEREDYTFVKAYNGDWSKGRNFSNEFTAFTSNTQIDIKKQPLELSIEAYEVYQRLMMRLYNRGLIEKEGFEKLQFGRGYLKRKDIRLLLKEMSMYHEKEGFINKKEMGIPLFDKNGVPERIEVVSCIHPSHHSGKVDKKVPDKTFSIFLGKIQFAHWDVLDVREKSSKN